MKKQYVMAIGLGIVIILALSAFQFMADTSTVKGFKMKIENVRLTRIGMTSADVFVTVNCTNPTDRDLSIASATFDVFIAESYVGNSSLAHFTIARKSSKDLTFLLTLTYANLAHAVMEGITNRNFTITATGKAQGYVFFGLFTTTVPFSISATYP